MIIQCNDQRIRYTGRWNVTDATATTTATGNYFEFSYTGQSAVLGFDLTNNITPYPHLYISVDSGANVEVTLDRFIRIFAQDGTHTVRVIFKSAEEQQERWFAPLVSKISLATIEADSFAEVPKDDRPVIEFIGDSITEGIAIDVDRVYHGDRRDLMYINDATATYAWLTAEALNFRPVIMGYGAEGAQRTGNGNVPPVTEAYPFYSDGCPRVGTDADYVVINHGTNDRCGNLERFQNYYYNFLHQVRENNPRAKIVALTPFGGYLTGEIKAAVDRYVQETNDAVFYINTASWISPEPLHPLRDGHKTVAQNLTRLLREKFSI